MIGRINRGTVVLVAGTLACGVVVALAAYAMLMVRSRIVTGHCRDLHELSRIPEFSPVLKFLPESGKDVRYFAMPHAAIFEVSLLCSQDQFLKWAVCQGWSNAEIQGTMRRAIFTEYYSAPGAKAPALVDISGAYNLRTMHVRRDGSRAEARHMIYDPRQGRAFLQLDLDMYLAGDLVNDVSTHRHK